MALDAATAASSADLVTRQRRRVDVIAELGRLSGVRARVEVFAMGSGIESEVHT